MSFNGAQQGAPLFNPDTASYSIPAPPEHHLTPVGANAHSASGLTAPPSGPIKRKPKPAAKTKPSKQLSKSLSTPQLRGPIMSDAELDKKRNKLGYQRISIACAHCRRRKIRCLVADEDPEGRCQNCIRLKKDCVFYPVEQQAALDARSESSSKASVAPSASSSTVPPSPIHGDTRSYEQLGQLGHQFGGGGFQSVPSSVSSTSYQGIPIAPNTVLQSQGNYPPDHGYPLQPEPSATWSPQEFVSPNQPVPSRGPSNVSQQWATPFPGTPNPQQRSLQTAQTFSYAAEQAVQQWPNQQPHPPVRSMSVPGYTNHELHPSFHHPVQQPADTHIRNAYEAQQGGGSRMGPVTPTQPALHGQPAFMVAQDQQNPSMAFIPQQYHAQPHPMQAGWYGNVPPFTQGEEPRVGLQQSLQGNFHSRPG